MYELFVRQNSPALCLQRVFVGLVGFQNNLLFPKASLKIGELHIFCDEEFAFVWIFSCIRSLSNTYKILVGKSEVQRQFRRPRRK
jgi:hypothetical protein